MTYTSFMQNLFNQIISFMKVKFWCFGFYVSFWNLLCFGILVFILLRLFYRFFR